MRPRHNLGKALTVIGAYLDNEAPIMQWDALLGEERRNQKFVMDPPFTAPQLSDIGLRDLDSGKVLDVFEFPANDGAPIIQFDEHGGDNQR